MGGKKKTNKKNQKSKVIYVVLAVILLIAAGVWYLYGKPDAHEEVQTKVVETEIPSTPLRNQKSGKEASNPSLDDGHADNTPLSFGNPSDSK